MTPSKHEPIVISAGEDTASAGRLETVSSEEATAAMAAMITAAGASQEKPMEDVYSSRPGHKTKNYKIKKKNPKEKKKSLTENPTEPAAVRSEHDLTFDALEAALKLTENGHDSSDANCYPEDVFGAPDFFFYH